MTDEKQNEDVDKSQSRDSGPLAGERLAEARRQQSITVVEVSKELHLDERKVRALEQNEFEILGAPVFAKGHLRKYAQLVGVPIDDVLADYYALNRSSPMPPVVGTVRKPTRELTPGPWLAVIIAIILIATAYWYFVARNADDSDAIGPKNDSVATPAESSAEITADEQIDERPVSVVNDDLRDTGVAAPQTSTDTMPEPEVRDEAAPPVVAETPALPDGQVTVTLQFSGDCWTEITDAGGRKLFFDLGREGRVRTITGRAPLAVLFGNADNVSVRVNGEDYAIAATDRRGQTARLTIRVPE